MKTKKEFFKKLQLMRPADKSVLASGVSEGVDALVLGEMARALYGDKNEEAPSHVLHIASDDRRLSFLEDALNFFAPDAKIISLPSWDCVPYDRVSPNAEISSKRMAALARMLASTSWKAPVIVLSTVNAVLQKLPPREFVKKSVLQLVEGKSYNTDKLVIRLEKSGYVRASTVMEPGDYAVRGGIVDLFPPARAKPVRLDFFGDELEKIRSFEPDTQRTVGKLSKLTLLSVGEVPLGEEIVSSFRRKYVSLFGPAQDDDVLYETISAGHRYEGMEHWLPLFHDRLETVFDYLPNSIVSFDTGFEEARKDRLEQVYDHYESRAAALEQKAFGTNPYHPVPVEDLFLSTDSWDRQLGKRPAVIFSPFSGLSAPEGFLSVDLETRRGRSFSAERTAGEGKVYEAVIDYIVALQSANKRVLISCYSNGSRERLSHLLEEKGLSRIKPIDSWQEALLLDPKTVGMLLLPLEQGIDTAFFSIIGEQDILGDRLIRKKRRSKSDANIISEATALTVGDLVVHAEHGIARFNGLRTIEAAGAAHDCVELEYAGQDKLFLPVENIDLLSRFGSDDEGVRLDKLGGVAWQARKANLKKRIREIAHELIRVAAMREVRKADILSMPDNEYEAFAAHFPFETTEDQGASIEAVLEDLEKGRPMDRLVCGDVGFGKTEVAIRAAFVAAMAGKQVALVVPTTLLARQHFKNFEARLSGYPVKVAQLSRMVSAKQMSATKEAMKTGDVDIVIGTHALLAKTIKFHDLGLLIIDEEQHFGVKHKEQLKELKEDVHVLTLTATPIPRTLQMALTGVRDLSIIATPPVDRMAVRSFIGPFDGLVLREALMRERYRGGQSFFVVPRVSDLDDARAFLEEFVPDLKVAVAHGRMAAGQLEDIMTAFYERQYDVLLSTTIVESGLDVPTANTMIIYRAHMFGLAQLYQLRGRVGRSKTRAYAYFTTPPDMKLTENAEKRLKVLHSLDSLGAGFTLASHDLDIRGAGNLLGDEQSGHIREVGFELYQSMLEETVQSLKDGGMAEQEEQWSPRIELGISVLIPNTYVEDLQVRLGLYRRLSSLETKAEIDMFAAELSDRFGKLPTEALYLLETIYIKTLCRKANIERVDAGPKGAVLILRNANFANPDGLEQYARENVDVSLTPPDKIVVKGEGPKPGDRLKLVRETIHDLVGIAEKVNVS